MEGFSNEASFAPNFPVHIVDGTICGYTQPQRQPYSWASKDSEMSLLPFPVQNFKISLLQKYHFSLKLELLDTKLL